MNRAITVNALKPQLLGLSLVLLWMSTSVFSQDIRTTRDIGVWTSVSFNHKINKQWRISASQGFRSFDNAIKLQKSITDLSIRYRIDKQFSLGAGFRYAYDRKKDYTFSHDLRYNIDAKFQHKLARKLFLQYRLRYQHTYNNALTFRGDFDEKSNIRNRLRLRYSLHEHSLHMGVEIFREYIFYKEPSFDNIRFTIGDEINAGKGDFSYAIAYERELDKKHPLNFFFLSLNYSINL